ncbi:MAG: GTP cyclohydrolase I FolE [Myxococcales bacterium]|nr:GTP cyclohydrolase I FolE [Myxococcales bacterium]
MSNTASACQDLAPTVDTHSAAPTTDRRFLETEVIETSATEVDTLAAERAVRDLLVALGEDPTDASLRETPRRVAAAFTELLRPQPFQLTTFPNEAGYHEPVIVRDIPVRSLCAHHMLPFIGVAHVAYLPGERIVGLSKLARLVEHFSRRLQVQEQLTAQIADALVEQLRPRGVGVLVSAEHLCMTVRGVRARGTHTTTSALRGLVREDPSLRAELIAELRAQR